MKIPQTVDEILEFIHANSKPGDWFLDNFGLIRFSDASCPICWLGTKCNRNTGNWLAREDKVGVELGLEYEVWYFIARASDAAYPYSPALRRQIMNACYLEEPK